MKESARIALSYVRAHAAELGISDDAFDGKEFHVHVPAGAIPKDGPSAGITMTTALASLLSDRPVKHIYEELKRRLILVRYMAYEGYGDGLRISVGTDAETDRLLEELRRLV